MPNHFGSEFRQMRKQAGYRSTERLAAEMRQHGADISGAAIGHWERGTHPPTRDNLRVAEQILGSGGHLAQLLDYPAIEDSPTSQQLADHEGRLSDLERRLAAVEVATTPSAAVEEAILTDPDLSEDRRQVVADFRRREIEASERERSRRASRAGDKSPLRRPT